MPKAKGVLYLRKILMPAAHLARPMVRLAQLVGAYYLKLITIIKRPINMTHSSKQYLRRTQWTIFGLVIVAYMLSFFHRVAPAALSTDLQASFSATSAQLGIIAAVF